MINIIRKELGEDCVISPLVGLPLRDGDVVALATYGCGIDVFVYPQSILIFSNSCIPTTVKLKVLRSQLRESFPLSNLRVRADRVVSGKASLLHREELLDTLRALRFIHSKLLTLN